MVNKTAAWSPLLSRRDQAAMGRAAIPAIVIAEVEFVVFLLIRIGEVEEFSRLDAPHAPSAFLEGS